MTTSDGLTIMSGVAGITSMATDEGLTVIGLHEHSNKTIKTMLRRATEGIACFVSTNPLLMPVIAP